MDEFVTILASAEKTTITNAMKWIEAKTCIRFAPKTTETSYASIIKGAAGSGCSSNVRFYLQRLKLIIVNDFHNVHNMLMLQLSPPHLIGRNATSKVSTK